MSIVTFLCVSSIPPAQGWCVDLSTEIMTSREFAETPWAKK